MIEVLYVLIATSMACAILGPFIVLRNLSMTTDALSHSVFLGIVLAFMIVRDLGSIWLTVGAALFGLLTVFCVELISKNKLVKSKDALGVVFPLFFSIAVILLTKFLKKVHLDIDMVIMGNPLFAPFIRVFNLPRALVVMSIVFVINLIFIFLCFKELKISTFDAGFAKLNKIKTNLIFYILMTLTSLTCVSAFDSVGGILVISFFVTPAASACIITKDLKYTLLLSVLYGIVNSVIGYYVAINLNVSVSGMCAFVSIITCALTIVFNPSGYVYKMIMKYRKHKSLKLDIILIHLYRHQLDKNDLNKAQIQKHLAYSKQKTDSYLTQLLNENLIIKIENVYKLSENGLNRVMFLLGKKHEIK